MTKTEKVHNVLDNLNEHALRTLLKMIDISIIESAIYNLVNPTKSPFVSGCTPGEVDERREWTENGKPDNSDPNDVLGKDVLNNVDITSKAWKAFKRDLRSNYFSGAFNTWNDEYLADLVRVIAEYQGQSKSRIVRAIRNHEHNFPLTLKSAVDIVNYFI